MGLAGPDSFLVQNSLLPELPDANSAMGAPRETRLQNERQVSLFVPRRRTTAHYFGFWVDVDAEVDEWVTFVSELLRSPSQAFSSCFFRWYSSSRQALEELSQEFGRRIRARRVFSVQNAQEWGPVETAMNQISSQGMMDSVKRLKRRYPQAIPNALAAFEEAYLMVVNDPPSDFERALKQEAAFRFVERVRVNFTQELPTYPYRLSPSDLDLNTGLNIQQFIALAWFAANDTSIFIDPRDVEDRRIGLLDSFAVIQRAHNDHDEDQAILWDELDEEDAPSCFLGTVKRILESLDQVHPDVRLNSAPPTRSEVATDIRQQNERIFPSFWLALSEPSREQIRQYVDEANDEIESLPQFETYRAQLRHAVRTGSPLIPEELLAEQTNTLAMLALLTEAIDQLSSETLSSPSEVS